jgi:hypothetical protein
MPKLQLLGPTLVRPFATKPAGGWPAVAGTIRPPAPREVRAYYAKLGATDAKDADAQTRAQAEFYAGLIKSWDVLGEGDQPAPVTPEAVGSLPFPVWAQLEDIALGYLGEQVLGN